MKIRRPKVNQSAQSSSQLTDQILTQIRSEFTVMPRFMFHQPLDYDKVSYPKKRVLPNRHSPLVPSDEFRFGYAPGDEEKYLAWGSYDASLILEEIRRAGLQGKGLKILDFGCSSGRVMRHFSSQIESNGWRIYGCDIQAKAIESMRADNWSNGFEFFTCTTIPHLPFEDNSLDVIYSYSVFTHTKYLWDGWLLELKRILKPGGLMIHTVHLEKAWEFYHTNRNEKWVQESQAPEVYQTPTMEVDYLFDGDASVSQVFWKEDVLKNYWSRHFASLEILPPAAEYSFQNRVILRK